MCQYQKPDLDVRTFINEANEFSRSKHYDPSLSRVTDGKAIGTYLEHKFRDYLSSKYNFSKGSSSNGIDFPSINTDMKVTSIKQPQSSCPYKSAKQKIYGLGYHLILFVYDKSDCELIITDTIFIEESRTADYQTTVGILDILERNGNKDDIIGFMIERNLPVDEIELSNIADEIFRNPPKEGFLTISNALQWRLQYARVIEVAGTIQEVHSVFKISRGY